METFASSENKDILYWDLPFYKKINKNGSICDFVDSEALSQAVKIWLACKENEKVRSTSGGIIYKYIGKVMDDEQADNMKNDITQGLKYDFNPPLTPILVNVMPNYEKERWEISIVAINQKLGIGVNTRVYVSNRG